MRKLTLAKVLRPIFRKYARKELNEWAKQIRAARRQEPRDKKRKRRNPPAYKQTKRGKGDKPRGGPVGGSLAKGVKKVLKLKRWGYVLRFHTLGQKMTWFRRGKESQSQAPRPIEVETDTDGLTRDIARAVAKAFSDYDRSARA